MYSLNYEAFFQGLNTFFLVLFIYLVLVPVTNDVPPHILQETRQPSRLLFGIL